MTSEERKTLASRFTSISELLESHGYNADPEKGFVRIGYRIKIVPLTRLQMSVASFVDWADGQGLLDHLEKTEDTGPELKDFMEQILSQISVQLGIERNLLASYKSRWNNEYFILDLPDGSTITAGPMNISLMDTIELRIKHYYPARASVTDSPSFSLARPRRMKWTRSITNIRGTWEPGALTTVKENEFQGGYMMMPCTQKGIGLKYTKIGSIVHPGQPEKTENIWCSMTPEEERINREEKLSWRASSPSLAGRLMMMLRPGCSAGKKINRRVA